MAAIQGVTAGSIKEIRDKISKNQYKLYGIFIYSDLDKSFINFLSEAHHSLAIMSGADMFLFWFENFSRDSVVLWKPGEESLCRSKIERSESLRIARAFAVPMSHTPCLLICQRLVDKNSVVYSFDNSWSYDHLGEHFKGIFDVIEPTLKDVGDSSQDDLYKILEAGFNRLKIKKWVKRLVAKDSVGNILRTIATTAGVLA